jgi:hypothetical protein
VNLSVSGIFVGHASHAWQSGSQRLACLKALGICSHIIDEAAFPEATGFASRVRRAWGGDYFTVEEVRAYNRHILGLSPARVPDFIWFEWPRRLEADTLRELKARWPHCLMLCFQDDNPFGDRIERSIWRRFIENIPFYDVHLLKRQSDIIEFGRRGAKSARIFRHGVFEPIFYPNRSAMAESCIWPISFVGTALDHRVDYVADLIGRYQLPVTVFGGSWRKTWVGLRHGSHFHPHANGEAYRRVIWRSGISLGFVSSSNRDEYSMRSFEIPGCSGFFLAERTPVHQELFAEGKEAEFFSSIEECADKAKHYLGNTKGRLRIAQAGYERCLRSGYSLKLRVAETITELFPGWRAPT